MGGGGMSEIKAVCEALQYAARVANEQHAPAYVSTDGVEYYVDETDSLTGRFVCEVGPDGKVTWGAER